MPVKKLKDFLDRNNVRYVTISHSRAYTAQEIAALTHTPGREMAKTVMVKLDDRMVMAVLPASHQVDTEMLRSACGAKKAELASEQEFKGLFPECETGAMPPFGNLYGIDVCVSKALTKDKEIAFNAGSHTELIRMTYRDFEKLAQPQISDFSTKALRSSMR